VFDLSFVDWFLGQPDWRVIPAWTEPTCWAALAMRAAGHAVDPTQLTNLYPSAKVTDTTVGAHFLSAYRSQWKDLLDGPVHGPLATPHQLRFQPLKALSAAALAINQSKRKLQNTMLRRLIRP
jgi:hypothetical protein